jgi:hypothetical protein
MFAAISAKNIQKFEEALSFCNLGLQKNSNYLDLLMYRAKLYQNQGNF